MRRILQKRKQFAKRYNIVKRTVFAWVDRLDPKTAETSNLARGEFEPLALFRLRQYWVAVPWSGIKRAFRRTTKENRAALHPSPDAARSYDLSATFAGPVKNRFQRALSQHAIRVYLRKVRRPLLVFTGFAVFAMVALASVSLFPVGHFQRSGSVSFRPETTMTIDPNAAESPSALAAQRMTSLGRLKLDKELTSRLTTNLTLTEAKNYVQGRNMLAQSLAAQMDADAVMFEQEFVKKSCAPAAELRFASTMWELTSFQENHIDRLLHLNTSTPAGELLRRHYVASAEATKNLKLNILFRVGDAALNAKCFDLADELYRKVVPIAFSVQEMHRAQLGIQSAKDRKAQHR